MATVIGIFENLYENNKALTIVKPGTQTRRFTHIKDTIEICYEAWKKINVLIIVFHIKKHIQSMRLQECLGQKLSILDLDWVKDMRQL